jgi:hypothetical protein
MAPGLLIAAIAVLFLVNWATTLPIFLQERPTQPTFLPFSALATSRCEHLGNADLYGLGIRLGIYLQILSTILGMIFLPDVLYDFQDSNAILLLAILIALIKNTPGRDIQEIDVIILLRIVWCIIISGFSLLDIKVEYHAFFRTDNPFGGVSATLAIIARALIAGSVTSYNVWFWFKGAEYLDVIENCPAYLFLFAKFSAHGPVRSFYKFTSVVLMVAYGTLPLTIWLYMTFVVLVLGLLLGFLLIFYVLYYPVVLPLLGIYVFWRYLQQPRKSRLTNDRDRGSPSTSSPAKTREAWKEMVAISRLFVRVFFNLWRDVRERLIRSAAEDSVLRTETTAAAGGGLTVRYAAQPPRRTNIAGPTGLMTPISPENPAKL